MTYFLKTTISKMLLQILLLMAFNNISVYPYMMNIGMIIGTVYLNKQLKILQVLVHLLEKNQITVHDHNIENKENSKLVEGNHLPLCFSSFELLRKGSRVTNQT